MLDLLWPPLCPACGGRAERAGDRFCEECWSALRAVRPGRDDLEPGTPPVHAAFSVDALFLQMLGASKYAGFRAVGRRLAWEAAAELAPRLPSGTLVPVPLTRARRRQRGFNQTEDFAETLARAAGRAVGTGLSRRRGGRAQAGRAREERAAAVRGAFVADPDRVPEGPVLLVDDVVTTGSTACACAAALRSAGVGVAGVAAIGRAFARLDEDRPPRDSVLARL